MSMTMTSFVLVLRALLHFSWCLAGRVCVPPELPESAFATLLYFHGFTLSSKSILRIRYLVHARLLRIHLEAGCYILPSTLPG